MPNLTVLDRPVMIPPALDGSAGSNRAPRSGRQIGADTDLAAVGLWLLEFRESPHTFRSYRKEAVRLLTWTIEVRGKALSSLTREDCLAYEAFLEHPPESWSGAALPKRGSTRRLLTTRLSPASRRQATGILSGLFTYLVNAGYLAGNPWALQRRRQKARSRPAIDRYLDQTLWEAVLACLDDEPRSTARDRQRHERDRWVLRLLYGTALRAAEAADARAGDFVSRRGRWWLTVRGKGGVIDDVPASDALLADYARYRGFLELPTTWTPTDRTPLILGIAGRGERALTATAIYLIVKACFARAATYLETSDAIGADRLRRASTHWLRHTAATHQADAGIDVRYIQRNLRHASIAVTSIYLHSDDDARHEGTARDKHDMDRSPSKG